MAEDKKIIKEEEKLEKELEELKKKCDEYLNGWKRERADFLNYKKDEMERIGNLAKYANEELILNFLPILDNIYLAEAHLQDEGISQIKKQFLDLLKKEGITPIEVINKEFDPNLMESIGEVTNPKIQIPNENSGDPFSAKTGSVVEEIQRGYTLNGKVIRVAKVRVTK